MKISKQTISLILSLVSIAGVGLTSWLSVKGRDKAVDKEGKKEKLKCYVPAIISGIGTSACIFGAHHISAKEIAKITAACSAITASNNTLQNALKENLGEEKAKKIIKDSVKESITVPKKRSIESTGNGSLLCYESYSSRLFYSSMQAVQEAEAKLSKRYLNGYAITLNDFYDYLGISRSTYGEQWGWVPELDMYHPEYYDDNPLCFDDYLAEDDETGKPVYIIALYNYPLGNWMDEVID